tara:strand:- start:59 stop:331 length:273 start_codon:yes stop_codon:yes gene_type:complete
MSCFCEKCNPYVFTEERAKAHGYNEELIPDLLWGIGPNDLHNVTQEDVFTYEWIRVHKVEELAQIIANGFPYIVNYDEIYKGVKMVAKAA